jgi:glutamine phosphoribosylpyrophosphate amidotransferase
MFLGADSVGYLSLESLRKAVGDTTNSFCSSCFTGNYVSELVQLEVTERAPAPDEAGAAVAEASRHDS